MFGLEGGVPPCRHGDTYGVPPHASDNGVEHRFTDLLALVAWLDEHEQEHAGFTTVQNWLLDDQFGTTSKRWSRESGDL